MCITVFNKSYIRDSRKNKMIAVFSIVIMFFFVLRIKHTNYLGTFFHSEDQVVDFADAKTYLNRSG